jgi:hypothetical protein
MSLNLESDRLNALDNSPVPRAKSSRSILLIGTISWLGMAVIGLWLLWVYETTPGKAAESPRQWPAVSRIHLDPDHATLVMLAHPHCPCTRASMGELASIMAHSQGRLRAYVLFVRPEGFSDGWEVSDLWQSAADIPGVKPILDGDGKEARLFNAATSGQTVLYNPQGRLLFSGGITGARGHFGDNAGQGAVVAIVNSQLPAQTETSVFGCPLFNPESECQVSIDEKIKR